MASMTVTDIADIIYVGTGCTRKVAKATADDLCNALADTILAGDKVTLKGIGTIKAVRRAARKANNPKTGERMEVPSKLTISMKPSTSFKEVLNEIGLTDKDLVA